MTASTAKHRIVIEHVLSRLHAIGISEVFGVPGDYAFPVQDAIVNFPGIEWVGCCNGLNAAYAADGFARFRGLGAVSTTYEVGELSAINAVAGAYAEHLPVVHRASNSSRVALVNVVRRRWPLSPFKLVTWTGRRRRMKPR